MFFNHPASKVTVSSDSSCNITNSTYEVLHDIENARLIFNHSNVTWTGRLHPRVEGYLHRKKCQEEATTHATVKALRSFPHK